MKKGKIAGIILGVILAIGISAWFLSRDKPKPENNNNANTSQSTEADNNSTEVYTKEVVAAHNTAEDCWTIISGDVYNISEYVSDHPGGKEIQRACGIDGTSLFTSRQTSDGQKVGSGTGHSSTAENILIQYRIGSLGQ